MESRAKGEQGGAAQHPVVTAIVLLFGGLDLMYRHMLLLSRTFNMMALRARGGSYLEPGHAACAASLGIAAMHALSVLKAAEPHVSKLLSAHSAVTGRPWSSFAAVEMPEDILSLVAHRFLDVAPDGSCQVPDFSTAFVCSSCGLSLDECSHDFYKCRGHVMQAEHAGLPFRGSHALSVGTGTQAQRGARLREESQPDLPRMHVEPCPRVGGKFEYDVPMGVDRWIDTTLPRGDFVAEKYGYDLSLLSVPMLSHPSLPAVLLAWSARCERFGYCAQPPEITWVFAEVMRCQRLEADGVMGFSWDSNSMAASVAALQQRWGPQQQQQPVRQQQQQQPMSPSHFRFHC
jgi:hypothetical protein